MKKELLKMIKKYEAAEKEMERYSEKAENEIEKENFEKAEEFENISDGIYSSKVYPLYLKIAKAIVEFTKKAIDEETAKKMITLKREELKMLLA